MHGVSPQATLVGIEPSSPHIAPASDNSSMRKRHHRMTVSRTVWPSGLRRWLKAQFRKGVGSNPTAVTHTCTLAGPNLSPTATSLVKGVLHNLALNIYLATFSALA